MARVVVCGAMLAIAALASGGGTQAQLHGVAVQVNEGKPVPTLAQLQAVLKPGDLVRDVLGWHRVDRNCDLYLDPARPIAIPASMSDLYERVQAAGGRNFVTLAFNNVNCGQATNSGAKDFPNTDFLRAEFAAYAVRVVKQVPALAGVSLWNEFTGTFKGGYTSRAPKLTAYCRLANAVITEIRKVDEAVPIAIGATVGWNIDEYFIDIFDTYGCLGRNDPTIWLDVHPYLTKMSGRKSDWDLWNESLGRVRAHGITNKFPQNRHAAATP